eukprot:1146003-Pelagomonas_calceolata.AAC.5
MSACANAGCCAYLQIARAGISTGSLSVPVREERLMNTHEANILIAFLALFRYAARCVLQPHQRCARATWFAFSCHSGLALRKWSTGRDGEPSALIVILKLLMLKARQGSQLVQRVKAKSHRGTSPFAQQCGSGNCWGVNCTEAWLDEVPNTLTQEDKRANICELSTATSYALSLKAKTSVGLQQGVI